MRVSSYAVSRPAYYDRNSTSVIYYYQATVGPHAVTERWRYTVATGKKGIQEFAVVSANRATAATSEGNVYAFIKLFSGASSLEILYPIQAPATLATEYRDQISTSLTLYAGEYVAGYTNDTSTGGTVSYSLGIKGTEYDV